MTTISVPLTPELTKFIQETTEKSGMTKADIMRRALKMYAEECAVQKILRASGEPSLKGELVDLAKQID